MSSLNDQTAAEKLRAAMEPILADVRALAILQQERIASISDGAMRQSAIDHLQKYPSYYGPARLKPLIPGT